MEQGALHWDVVDLFHYRNLRRLKSRATQKGLVKNLIQRSWVKSNRRPFLKIK